MDIERRRADPATPPFPIYPAIVEQLLTAHAGYALRSEERDSVIAHILATCSGYAAADLATMAQLASRLGLAEAGCVRIHQVVDAMLIFATAYVMQSACGRVVLVIFRGTEPANLGNWLGDADIGPSGMACDNERASVHAGFHRNLRAVRLPVLAELREAIEGRSLADCTQRVDHPAEAIYVAGHSLGGAMAALMALGIMSDSSLKDVAARLRAVYTFGQPMVATEPLPAVAGAVGRILHRHVMPRDPVPALPPVSWGPFAHFGHEYTCENGAWCATTAPTARATSAKDIARMILQNGLGPARRGEGRFDMNAHFSRHYIDSLRPAGQLTEFGDHD